MCDQSIQLYALLESIEEPRYYGCQQFATSDHPRCCLRCFSERARLPEKNPQKERAEMRRENVSIYTVMRLYTLTNTYMYTYVVYKRIYYITFLLKKFFFSLFYSPLSFLHQLSLAIIFLHKNILLFSSPSPPFCSHIPHPVTTLHRYIFLDMPFFGFFT